MNVSVETARGTNSAQEDACSPAGKRAGAPAAWRLQAPPARPAAKWPGRRGWVKLHCVEGSGAGRAGGINQAETVTGLLLARDT